MASIGRAYSNNQARPLLENEIMYIPLKQSRDTFQKSSSPIPRIYLGGMGGWAHMHAARPSQDMSPEPTPWACEACLEAAYVTEKR